MKLSDLVRDPGTDQLSGSKIWKHLWNVACMWAFIWLVWRGSITTAIDVAIFMAISGGSEVASKIVSMRFGLPQVATPTPAQAAGEVKP